jgi:hypothetical protein
LFCGKPHVCETLACKRFKLRDSKYQSGEIYYGVYDPVIPGDGFLFILRIGSGMNHLEIKSNREKIYYGNPRSFSFNKPDAGRPVILHICTS